jgi:hypothetical protein
MEHQTSSPAGAPSPFRRTLLRRAASAVSLPLLLLFLPSPAVAAQACPGAEAAWFTATATGTLMPYGYTIQGVLRTGKNNATTPVSSVGVMKFLSAAVVPSGDGANISGFVSGSEKQNVGGVITTLSFGGDNASTFLFNTADCTGTITRTFGDGSVIVWNVVLVDGAETIRYADTRANPAIEPGVMQLMK